MSELDQGLDDAVAQQDAPFPVAMTGNAAGATWSGAAGERSPGQPAPVVTVFRIFSMTRPAGGMAAMILIDRSQPSANATVESLLPEFAELKLLDGFGPDGPRLRAPRVKATVRQMATRTSGLVYAFWNEDMPRYVAASVAVSILSGLTSSMNYPLQFEPGTRRDYGIGIDGLGRVVEKISGQRIDQFCRDGIVAGLTAMLANQIGDTPIGVLKTAVPALSADAEFFAERCKSHCMAFMRSEEDVPGMRRAGVLNSHYWFDPKSDVVGLPMTQSLPFTEPRFMATDEAFEHAAYRQAHAPVHPSQA